MRLRPLEVLSAREIRKIHDAGVHILEHCGVKVLGRELFDFLASKGCSADGSSRIVRFSRAMIDDALSLVPRTFVVCDRTGSEAFELGKREPRIAAGHNAVNWADSESGETRPARISDVELFARICQHLRHIDMIGIPVMPQDAPNPQATLLYGVKAVVENSTKPIFFSTDRPSVNGAVIRMLQAAFALDMGERVYGIGQLSPTSPLYWEDGVCEALVQTLGQNVPLAILPEPNAGVSAPYTLAGLVTMNNTECLAGMVISQLLRPGSRVMYATSWTATDMQSGSALVGSTETSICRIAGAQMAMFYNVPSHTTAPNSDNHAHDEQNAWEKTLSAFCGVAAGNDLIVNCGMFATGLTCSHEQLLMDEMMCAASLRILRGMEVTGDTVAQELIESVGPRGESYLTQEHTLRYLRSDEYLQPRLSVNGPFAAWAARGSRDTYELARQEVRRLRAVHAPPFEERRRQMLEEIVAGFAG